jgi:hypothetical protein
MNFRISFNCLSSIEWCKVCTQNTRSALTKYVFVLKLRRDNMKLPFSRSAKRLVQGVDSHPQEFEPCVKIWCKECIDTRFD